MKIKKLLAVLTASSMFASFASVLSFSSSATPGTFTRTWGGAKQYTYDIELTFDAGQNITLGEGDKITFNSGRIDDDAFKTELCKKIDAVEAFNVTAGSTAEAIKNSFVTELKKAITNAVFGAGTEDDIKTFVDTLADALTIQGIGPAANDGPLSAGDLKTLKDAFEEAVNKSKDFGDVPKPTIASDSILTLGGNNFTVDNLSLGNGANASGATQTWAGVKSSNAYMSNNQFDVTPTAPATAYTQKTFTFHLKGAFTDPTKLYTTADKGLVALQEAAVPPATGALKDAGLRLLFDLKDPASTHLFNVNDLANSALPNSTLTVTNITKTGETVYDNADGKVPDVSVTSGKITTVAVKGLGLADAQIFGGNAEATLTLTPKAPSGKFATAGTAVVWTDLIKGETATVIPTNANNKSVANLLATDNTATLRLPADFLYNSTESTTRKSGFAKNIYIATTDSATPTVARTNEIWGITLNKTAEPINLSNDIPEGNVIKEWGNKTNYIYEFTITRTGTLTLSSTGTADKITLDTSDTSGKLLTANDATIPDADKAAGLRIATIGASAKFTDTTLNGVKAVAGTPTTNLTWTAATPTGIGTLSPGQIAAGAANTLTFKLYVTFDDDPTYGGFDGHPEYFNLGDGKLKVYFNGGTTGTPITDAVISAVTAIPVSDENTELDYGENTHTSSVDFKDDNALEWYEELKVKNLTSAALTVNLAKTKNDKTNAAEIKDFGDAINNVGNTPPGTFKDDLETTATSTWTSATQITLSVGTQTQTVTGLTLYAWTDLVKSSGSTTLTASDILSSTTQRAKAASVEVLRRGNSGTVNLPKTFLYDAASDKFATKINVAFLYTYTTAGGSTGYALVDLDLNGMKLDITGDAVIGSGSDTTTTTTPGSTDPNATTTPGGTTTSETTEPPVIIEPDVVVGLDDFAHAIEALDEGGTLEIDSAEFIEEGELIALGADLLEAIAEIEGATIEVTLLDGTVVTVSDITDTTKDLIVNVNVEVDAEVDGYDIPEGAAVITPAATGALGATLSITLSGDQLAGLTLRLTGTNPLKLWHVSGASITDATGPASARNITITSGTVTIKFNTASFYVLSNTKPTLSVEATTPEVTDEPGETSAPEATDEPGETSAPEVTDEPGETTAPETTGESGETSAPDATGEPGETFTPAVTTGSPTTAAKTTAASTTAPPTATNVKTDAPKTTAPKTSAPKVTDVPEVTTPKTDAPKTEPEYTIGDVNGDNELTIKDALEILKYLAGMNSVLLTDDAAFAASLILDPSADEPTIKDVLEILKKLADMKSVLNEVWKD